LRPLQPRCSRGKVLQPDCDLDHQSLGERAPGGFIINVRHRSTSHRGCRMHAPGHAPSPVLGSCGVACCWECRWNVLTGLSLRRRVGRRMSGLSRRSLRGKLQRPHMPKRSLRRAMRSRRPLIARRSGTPRGFARKAQHIEKLGTGSPSPAARSGLKCSPGHRCRLLL